MKMRLQQELASLTENTKRNTHVASSRGDLNNHGNDCVALKFEKKNKSPL